MDDELEGFVRLDSPRKCLDWAKETYKYDDSSARELLGLPSKEDRSKAYVPGGPFVSTGDPEFDALLLQVTIQKTTAKVVIDPELQPEVAGEGWWQWRERDRTQSKTTKARVVPAFVANLDDRGGKFFIYCSRKEPEKIIYTPDAEHGRADRRVITTVGRFLTKNYAKKYTEPQIKKIAEDHKAMYSNPSVYFALGADQIAKIYDSGLGSCMSGKAWAAEHPARVYDGPDIAMAYLMSTTQKDKATARCLVNMSKVPMTFARIYGDVPLLEARLMQLGFVGTPGLKGARLRKEVSTKHRKYVGPYIDSGNAVYVDGDFLVVDSTNAKLKHYSCLRNDGFFGDGQLSLEEMPKEVQEQLKHNFICHNCGGERKQPEGHDIDNAGNSICTSCRNTYFVHTIYDRSNTLRWVRKENAIEIDGVWYNPNDRRLMEREEIVQCRGGIYVRRKDVVEDAMNGGYLLKKDAVTTVDGYQVHKAEVLTDPQGRFVWVNHAKSVIGPEGRTLYFHPIYLPLNVKKVGGKFKYTEEAVA